MRDKLCKERDLNLIIMCNKKSITKAEKDIQLCEKDEKNNIQRYPASNDEVIFNTKGLMFLRLEKIVCAEYSLGTECSKLDEYFLKMIKIVQDLNYEQILYINMLELVSLGILLEISENKFQILVDVADDAKVNDILLDCLINAYGMKRNFSSSEYEKEKPYKEAVEIIELANSDKTKASAKLEEYAHKNWLKGHSDYGWTRAHKEPGYCGLWSFEAAAIAKIFNLDDSQLKDDNHYPYDLAHYKNNMTFNREITLTREELPEDVQNDKLIPANPDLEQMMPNEFREEINQLLVDFGSLEDEDFWEKYNLMELWYTVDDYRADKLGKSIIGNIVINRLVSLGYILQLDYKEDVEDYVEHMKNYWKDSEIKLIRFELDNDQNYYAKVPVSCNLKSVYEAKIYE